MKKRRTKTEDDFDVADWRLRSADDLVCICGYEFEHDDYVDLIEYQDGPPIDLDCPACERVLIVQQFVQRTWNASVKIEDVLDEPKEPIPY